MHFALAIGLCILHKSEMRTHPPLEVRFWSHVDKRGPDECWPWLGGNTDGYGYIRRGPDKLRVTRLSWEIANGRAFPEGLVACHSCDNPPCVNPNHIWAGTYSDNMRDMVAKGRHVSARQTHCINGHAYEGQRPYPSEKPGRQRCRTCHYASQCRRVGRPIPPATKRSRRINSI